MSEGAGRRSKITRRESKLGSQSDSEVDKDISRPLRHFGNKTYVKAMTIELGSEFLLKGEDVVIK